jgi:hypothetical protein
MIISYTVYHMDGSWMGTGGERGCVLLIYLLAVSIVLCGSIGSVLGIGGRSDPSKTFRFRAPRSP